MKNITELIHRRRSIRTFDGQEVNEDDMQKIDLGDSTVPFCSYGQRKCHKYLF